MSTPKEILRSGIEAFRSGNINEAENIFKTFIKDYPDSDLADNACYNLAKIAVKKGNNADALNWYKYLIDTYPDSDAAYFGKDEYVELSRSMGKSLKEIPDECYYNGCKLMDELKYKEADKEFDRLISEYPDCEYVDNAYYKKAYICKLKGDKEGVKKYVDIIMTDYPESDAALIAETLL